MKTELEREIEKLNNEKQEIDSALKAAQYRLQQEQEKLTPKPIHQTVTTLRQVYKHLKCDPKKDVIKVDGFDKEEYNVLENLVKKMRICKVYNEGKIPTKKDQRWYPYWYLASSGSGLVFYHSYYGDGIATTGSAARLSFLQKLSTESYVKNFKDVEEGIIGL